MNYFRQMHMQRARAQALRLEKAKSDGDRTARIQEEALERLRKMKLHIDEKENQTRLLEKIEREKMLRIQKVRKAAVERLLETRRKEAEAYTALQQAVTEQAKTPEVQQETAELPTVEPTQINKPLAPIVRECAKVAAEAAFQEPAQSQSGMIFPQLDKESPASSTHEAVAVQPESPQSEPATAPVTEQSDEEFFEDAESVEIRSISSDEDGFMTDEEYDILDASDEDMP
jgi:next-to-BRCA1 protein 1